MRRRAFQTGPHQSAHDLGYGGVVFLRQPGNGGMDAMGEPHRHVRPLLLLGLKV
jgi:hypothetical protein